MTLEVSFSKWAITGISLFLVSGIGIASTIHFGADVSWTQLFAPICVYIGLQIICFLCVYWARRLARKQKKYGPITLLIGLDAWGTGLMIMHYGANWGILPRSDDFLFFSLFMAIVVVLSWFLIAKFSRSVPPSGF